VEQVNRTRPASGRANSHLPRELRVADRFECRHLLMPGLYELRMIARAPPGGEQTVDPITGVGKDLAYSPVAQARQQDISDSVGHLDSLRPRRHLPVVTPVLIVATSNVCDVKPRGIRSLMTTRREADTVLATCRLLVALSAQSMAAVADVADPTQVR